MKSLNDITLYDLMAEDLDIWVRKNKDFGIDIEIEDENGETIVKEMGIHDFAADSFATFCQTFLAGYNRACEL